MGKSKANFIKRLNDTFFYDGDYFQIIINERPEQLSKQQFTIELSTENGTTFIDTGITFYLKP